MSKQITAVILATLILLVALPATARDITNITDANGSIVSENATVTVPDLVMVIQPGWNLISVPFKLDNKMPFTVAGIDKVLYYNASAAVPVTLAVIQPLKSYWVHNNLSQNISVPLFRNLSTGVGGGGVPFQSIQLASGWNMIGYTGNALTTPATTMLGSLGNGVWSVADYNKASDTYTFYYITGMPSVSDLTMRQNVGYWVYTTRSDLRYAGDGSITSSILLLPFSAYTQDTSIPDVHNSTIFQGRVNINGASAPDGTSITAKAGNTLRGYDDGGTSGGLYNLAVLLSGADETITFFVNGVQASTYISTGNEKAKTITFNLSIAGFDTGFEGYPSIMGTHNGTIILNYNLTVSKMYTYPGPGTGGHSEYAAFYYPNGSLIANSRWSGYQGDWHNITFSQPFTLEANVTYNYTIRTGSYPQIIHKQNHTTPDGSIITSTEFIDANGRHYAGWIPAIRLEAAPKAARRGEWVRSRLETYTIIEK